MADLNASVTKLTGAIEQKLNKLNKSITTKELGELHSFLKEAKGILETLGAIAPVEEYEEMEYDESGEVFLDAFVDGCHLIKNLYALLDESRIKETESQWILDETKEYMDKAKEMFGCRIPPLPAMRTISKPKKKK
jgi:hypothetical protein